VLWRVLPVVPHRIIRIDPPCWMFDFSPDGSELATFSGDSYDPRARTLSSFRGKLQFWNVQNGTFIERETKSWDTVLPPFVESVDRRWWTMAPARMGDWQARYFDTLEKRIILPNLGAADNYPGGPISADGRYFFLSLGDYEAVVWDRHEDRIIERLAGFRHPLAMTSDARLLAATRESAEGWPVIRIFERGGLRELISMRASENDRVYHIAFSPDGKFVLAVTAGGPESNNPWTLHCWETQTGRECYSVLGVYWKRFAFGNDGQSLIVVRTESGDHRIEWRELSTGEIRRSVEIGGRARLSPRALDCSPDGSRIGVSRVSTETSVLDRLADRFGIKRPFREDDKIVETCMFDAQSGEHLGDIPADGLCWSPDGRRLAAPFGAERPYAAIGFWDIPPRKSLTWFAAGAALLALPIALAAWRRVRNLRAA
jgi:WD40 repeat protein